MTKKNTLKIGDLTIVPEARSRYLTLEMGGKKCRIHYKELWGAMFVLGDGKYREAMIPSKGEERMLFSRQLRVRVRVVNVMRLVLRWSCAHCGCDVAEAFARGGPPPPPGMLFDDPAAAATWFGGGCAACAPAPSARAPGAVALAVEASVLLEDGSAQAECWADGEPALQLLGLWGGAHDGGAGHKKQSN